MTLSSISMRKQPDSLCNTRGDLVILARKIISSGEGSIFTTSDASVLAKIYHQPSLKQGEKLKAMVGQGPMDSVAWPQDLVYEKGEIIGFLMPKIRNAKPFPYFYHPRLRLQHVPETTWYDLHKIAFNIAKTMARLHEKNIIIGDIKAENILIYPDGNPCFLDADSFQIEHPITKSVFNSSMGSEGFIPPELIGKHLARIVRTEIHDRFGLAVLIYYLLFGEHPFRGIWHGEGEPLSTDERVYKGLTALRKQKFVSRSPLSLSPSILSSDLKEAFDRAFVQGHLDHTKRPSALEWSILLHQSESQLELCTKNRTHFFYGSQVRCPWCAYCAQTKVDLFKSPYGVSKEDQFYSEKSMESALRSAQFGEAKKLLESKYLEGSKQMYSSELSKAEEVFDRLKRVIEGLKERPRRDAHIYDLWEAFPYKNSPQLKWRGFYFQGEEVIKVVGRSLGRAKAFKDFQELVETSRLLNRDPLYYFEELLQIFNSVSLEADSSLHIWPKGWKELEEKCAILSKKFGFLKKAILEESGEGVLQYWDVFFERSLEKLGLEIPAKLILNSYFSHLCQDAFESSSLRLTPTKGGYFLTGMRCQIPRTLQNKALPVRLGFWLKDSHQGTGDLFIEGTEFTKKGGKIFLAGADPKKRLLKGGVTQLNKLGAMQAQGAIALGSCLFGVGSLHSIAQNPVHDIIYYHIERVFPWFIPCRFLGIRSMVKRKGLWIRIFSPVALLVPEMDLVLHRTGEDLLDKEVKLSETVGSVSSFRIKPFQKERLWINLNSSSEALRGNIKKMKLTLTLKRTRSSDNERRIGFRAF